jgi:hypothetical protein
MKRKGKSSRRLEKHTSRRQQKKSSSTRRLTTKRRSVTTKHPKRAAQPARRRTSRTARTKLRPTRRVMRTRRGQSSRLMKVPAATGTRAVAVRSRKNRSIIGRYWNEVHRYVATGEASSLPQFAQVRLTDANGRRIVLLTDLQTLDQLAAAGVLSFEDVYGRRI